MCHAVEAEAHRPFSERIDIIHDSYVISHPLAVLDTYAGVSAIEE